jgi:hypothetical protein
MHDIRIPNVAQPIKGALCTIGHLYRPEMRGGALIQELWLYEDDLESQTRRVIKVFAPVTPKGRRSTRRPDPGRQRRKPPDRPGHETDQNQHEAVPGLHHLVPPLLR